MSYQRLWKRVAAESLTPQYMAETHWVVFKHNQYRPNALFACQLHPGQFEEHLDSRGVHDAVVAAMDFYVSCSTCSRFLYKAMLFHNV